MRADMRRDYMDVLRNTLYEYELKVSGHRASDYVDASDDHLDDILNHIVGLGKDVYFDVLNHIEKVRDYQKEAVESFTYVMTGRRPQWT